MICPVQCPFLTEYLHFIFIFASIRNSFRTHTDSIRYALPDALRLRLGLAIHPPRILQHILQRLHRTFQTVRARRHPARARQDASGVRARDRRLDQQLPRPLLAYLRTCALCHDRLFRRSDPEHEHAGVLGLAEAYDVYAGHQGPAY